MKSRSLKFIACIMICFLMGISISFTSHAAKSINEKDILWGVGSSNVLQVGDTIYLSMCSGSIESVLKPTGILSYNVKTKKVKKVCQVSASGMYYYDGCLYTYNDYMPGKYMGCIYRVNVKTGGKKKLVSNMEDFQERYKDRLYYYVKKDEEKILYSMRVDGTDKKKIIQGNLSNLYFFGDELYCYDRVNQVTYIASLDGSNLQEFVKGSLIGITDDGIYYSTIKSYNNKTGQYTHTYYKKNRNNGKITKPSFLKSGDSIHIVDNDIYYTRWGKNDTCSCYMAKNGNNSKKISARAMDAVYAKERCVRNKAGNKARFTYVLNYNRKPYKIANQNDKYYYIVNGKLYVQPVKSGKQKMIKTLSENMSVDGIVGNNIILEKNTCVNDSSWNRKLYVYNLKTRKLQLIYK